MNIKELIDLKEVEEAVEVVKEGVEVAKELEEEADETKTCLNISML